MNSTQPNHKRLLTAGIIFSITALLSACGGGSATSSPAVPELISGSTCTSMYTNASAGKFTVGQYLVLNNDWGRLNVPSGTTFSECVSVNQLASNSIAASWNWNLAEPGGKVTIDLPGGVKGYPEILFGQNPGDQARPGAFKPIQAKDIGSNAVAVDYKATHAATGLSWTFFDLYFMNSASVIHDINNMTNEISIIVQISPEQIVSPIIGGTGAFGTTIDTITIDNEIWDVVDGSPAGKPKGFFMKFISRNQKLSGHIDFNKFTDYFINTGYIKPENYLVSIEFGTEMASGAGSTTVQSYSVTCNKTVCK